MSSGAAFVFHIRRESLYEDTLVVRFEVLDGGMGVLGLRKPGRTDPAPSLHSEESGIGVEHLRGGRFVHVVTGGSRQSYALSRVTAELVQKIEENEWVTLDPITEYGFRYLVPPEGVADRIEGGAAVQLQPMKEDSVAEKLGGLANMLKAPRPQSVASAAATGTSTADASEASPVSEPSAPAGDLPAQQVPVSPALADSALDSLDLTQARTHLRDEMAKVNALHGRVAELERALEESKAREADLLAVLSKWQTRG